MIAPGALLLVADSTNCPDGLAGATVDQDFASTCPTDLVPATGTVKFRLGGGPNGDEAGAERDLRAAGIRVASVRVLDSPACQQDVVSFMLETGSGARVDCSTLDLASETSTVKCSVGTAQSATEDASSSDAGETKGECTITFTKRR